MNEMIERAAKALWALETDTDCHDYDQLAEFVKEETRAKVRAVFAAIWEPTEAMKNEGYLGVDYTPRDVWQAMVDEMLN